MSSETERSSDPKAILADVRARMVEAGVPDDRINPEAVRLWAVLEEQGPGSPDGTIKRATLGLAALTLAGAAALVHENSQPTVHG